MAMPPTPTDHLTSARRFIETFGLDPDHVPFDGIDIEVLGEEGMIRIESVWPIADLTTEQRTALYEAIAEAQVY